MRTTIKKWGNSLALRLSGPMASIPHFEEDMLVDVEISEDGIQVRPAKKEIKLPFKESDLLKGLSPKSAHADEIAHLTSKELGD